jgi:hypothetical protein
MKECNFRESIAITGARWYWPTHRERRERERERERERKGERMRVKGIGPGKYFRGLILRP